MTPWTGYIDRTLKGELRHPPLHAESDDDVISLSARAGQDGEILLHGDAPNNHWTGHIDKARAGFVIGCRFGFVIEGAVEWKGGRYVLTSTEIRVPEALRLPGDVGVAA